MMYTEEKGIWTVETTKDNLQRAIKETNLDIEVLQMVLPDKFSTKNLAFPVPCIIPSYGNRQKRPIIICQKEHGAVVLWQGDVQQNN
eukprot:1008845-Ditylum_brightwellii.AAC.1